MAKSTTVATEEQKQGTTKSDETDKAGQNQEVIVHSAFKQAAANPSHMQYDGSWPTEEWNKYPWAPLRH